MEDKQLLGLILKELLEMKSDISTIKSDIQDIKATQTQHTGQIQIIKEQTARNAELESTVKELVKDKELIKRILSN